MTFGVIGSGSWGTALAKILTDNGHTINWWIRNEKIINHLMLRNHNPQYLSSAYFNTQCINASSDVASVIQNSDCILMAVPSAYATDVLSGLDKNILEGKKVMSAIKGILPQNNVLLNQYLKDEFDVDIQNYFAVLGPCHAEEIAAEKLSYLTFSGVDAVTTSIIATHFKNDYVNTIENNDIYGVQFAAVLKNIYALGAGIAHGLEYGDNFLSVLIANSADEMAGFLKQAGIKNIEVGHTVLPSLVNTEFSIEQTINKNPQTTNHKQVNYAASVYLGDLLVTCYSLFSRNRTFGNMIGKGYSVIAAQLEMNMVAEGYNAAKCIHFINKNIHADMPIASTIYQILWQGLPAADGFKKIEETLI
ncbi:NAD(P)H-dependent glycerol-3-phosphate dehydrogenase [soil metagenome]